MKRLVASLVALAILALVPCTAAAAVLVDQAWGNTSQIVSASNPGPFQSVQNLAAINLHYGSRPAGGTLNGIGFADIVVVPFGVAPQNTAVGVTSPSFAPGVTLDYNFSGQGDLRELDLASITGPDAVVANNIAYDNRFFGTPAVAQHTMTFHGLGANQSVYVQLVGGQHGWNQTTTVLASGVAQGVWNSNRTNHTAGLFGFRARANSAGDLTVSLQTSLYGGMAAAFVSAADPLPSLPVMNGLNYWLDASNLDSLGNSTVAAGSPVNRWADLAVGNDAVVRSGTPDTAPVLVQNAINGKAAVRFDNPSDRLTSPATSTWGTVFIVNTLDPSTIDLEGIFGHASADIGIRRHVLSDPRWRGNPGYTNSGDLTGYPSGQGSLYVNGTYGDLVGRGIWHTLTAVTPAPIPNMLGPQLGGHNNGAYGREFLGAIAEVIVYDRILTPTERLWVGKYLSDKYALPLVVDERLTDTSQVVTNPFGDNSPLVQAVNFRYTSAPVTGSFQGIRFDNVDLSGAVPPTGPISLTANLVPATLTLNFPLGIGANSPRTQSASFTGTDAATLAAVANEMYYIGTTAGNDHPGVTMTFAGLWTNNEVYVELIGGDGGWNGDLLVKANGQTVGTWTDVADLNTTTASLFGFFAKTDSLGKLQLDLTIAAGNYAGISGIIITQRVPEPSTIALFGLGAVALAPLVRRRRAR